MKKILLLFLFFNNNIFPVKFVNKRHQDPHFFKATYSDEDTNKKFEHIYFLEKNSSITIVNFNNNKNFKLKSITINNNLIIQDKVILESDDCYEILINPETKATSLQKINENNCCVIL